MRKKRVLVAVAVAICLGIFAAAADAVQWAGNNYYLASGQNGFLNHTVSIQISEGTGENRAVCAGIRSYGDKCVGRGAYAFFSLERKVSSEPYLHNHDELGGYFFGWWY
jgi:opacity protein-like surface antigen